MLWQGYYTSIYVVVAFLDIGQHIEKRGTQNIDRQDASFRVYLNSRLNMKTKFKQLGKIILVVYFFLDYD